MFTVTVALGYSLALMDAFVQASPKPINIARPPPVGPMKLSRDRINVLWSWGFEIDNLINRPRKCLWWFWRQIRILTFLNFLCFEEILINVVHYVILKWFSKVEFLWCFFHLFQILFTDKIKWHYVSRTIIMKNNLVWSILNFS